jgi:hypothetical protein
VALDAADWTLVLGFALLPVAVVEAIKLARRTRSGTSTR